jgi:hypothetical protein
MHQKVNVLNSFNICPKSAFLKKRVKFAHSLDLYLSSLLVECVEDVACKSSHHNFYKRNE